MIPNEVLQGSTHQQWYALLGRDAGTGESQGEILIIMSFTVILVFSQIITNKKCVCLMTPP